MSYEWHSILVHILNTSSPSVNSLLPSGYFTSDFIVTVSTFLFWVEEPPLPLGVPLSRCSLTVSLRPGDIGGGPRDKCGVPSIYCEGPLQIPYQMSWTSSYSPLPKRPLQLQSIYRFPSYTTVLLTQTPDVYLPTPTRYASTSSSFLTNGCLTITIILGL